MSQQPHHQVPPHHVHQASYARPAPPPMPPTYGPGVVEHSGKPSIESVTVPLLLVFTFATFLVGATYIGTTQFHLLQNSVERLGLKIDEVADRIKERIERLEVGQRDNLTRQDHQLWCASAERANRNIGWACMEHPAPEPAPTVRGWQAKIR